VNAALYWLARMIESGADRFYRAAALYLASEDIGMADPTMVQSSHSRRLCD
jgi:putative ATPase